MPKITTITVRIDPEVKREGIEVLNKLGLSTSQAITLFFKQISLNKGLPFAVRLPTDDLPNEETLAATDDSIA